MGQVYHDNVNAVRDSYASVLRNIDGDRDKHAVFSDVESALEAVRGGPKPTPVAAAAAAPTAAATKPPKASKVRQKPRFAEEDDPPVPEGGKHKMAQEDAINRNASGRQEGRARAAAAASKDDEGVAPVCKRREMEAALAAAMAGRASRGGASSGVQRAGESLKVIIAGPPGVGKGTQCGLIVQKYGLLHLSSGDILRAEVAAGSEVGVEAKGYMEAGELVPDRLIVSMVLKALATPEARKKGWLLDGFPRNALQAQMLQAGGAAQPHIYLDLAAPEAEILRRLTGRRSDPDTGAVYHLQDRPPPEEAAERCVQRAEDSEEMARRPSGPGAAA